MPSTTTDDIAGRVTRALGDAPFEALLTVSPEGSKYLSGSPLPFALYYPKRPTVVLWQACGAPAPICSPDPMAGPRATSWITDLRPYREGDRATADVLAEVLVGALDD